MLGVMKPTVPGLLRDIDGISRALLVEEMTF